VNVSLRAAIFVMLPILWMATFSARAQSVVIAPTNKQQVIDGFGTLSNAPPSTGPDWYTNLYLNDMYCSMVRVYLTPSFVAPYSTNLYVSPWYGNNPPLPGPENNNVRTYTGAAASSTQPYTRTFAGQSAPIAVMGPDIDANGKLLVIGANQAEAGLLAQMGQGSKLQQLGDFKLFGSFWSPQPWVKLTSGNVYPSPGGTLDGSNPLPVAGTPFPFIWNGTFAGGLLDVSGTLMSVFNDGTANTSALTQFARMVTASLRKFQNQYGVKFYAISIQNELAFEEFYDSCVYENSAEYITALEAVRTELNKYPDLATIKIEGPEDVLGGDPYGMWQYGSGSTAQDKNLKFVDTVEGNSTSSAALSFYSIHGYDGNGVTSTGAASPTSWNYWTQGWTTSPAAGLPSNVEGISSFGKKSWMTETSGETTGWLDSSTSGGFPDSGAFSIALKLHQALTAGQESAWVYYEFNDGTTPADASSLTDATALANGPKYVAAKHYFRYIRPNSYRVGTTVNGSSTVLASSYINDASQSLTTVLINSASTAATATVGVPTYPSNIASFQAYTSSNGSYWQPSTLAINAGNISVPLPGYSVVTLTANTPAKITSGAVPAAGTLGYSYNFTFQASGTPPATYSLAPGSTLPPGVTLSSSGTLSGTPTTTGTFSGTVIASNGFGNGSTQTYTITVVAETETPTMPWWGLAALAAVLVAVVARSLPGPRST
jgi:O-glycosyl hydrolase